MPTYLTEYRAPDGSTWAGIDVEASCWEQAQYIAVVGVLVEVIDADGVDMVKAAQLKKGG
jgi:predicted Abi (CAAX) family protease